MKTRKLASLGLAAVMSLSLAAPVFAAGNNETVFTSTYTEPDIQVTVPQTGTVALNPLGLDIDLVGDGSDTTQIIKGQQIVTTPVVMVNNSSMDLSVSASVATTIAGTKALTLTKDEQTLLGKGDDPEAGDYVAPKTNKSAFVFFQMASTTLTDSTDQEAINKDAAKWAYDYTEKANAEGTIVPETKGVIVLNGTKTVEGEDLVTLKAARDGEVVSGGIARMRLCGKMVASPKNADDAWKADDKITATVTFSFAPAAAK